MHSVLILINVLVLSQWKPIDCVARFGSVFPIPLPVENDDPGFQQCPKESGAYTHSRNCSLFHMCSFGVHSIYACVDGFFFNPHTGKCQQWQIGNGIDCVPIIREMTASSVIPLEEPLQDPNNYHRRLSAAIPCTQPGVFPDVLNCALFHYCHPDLRHQIFECPNGLNFDPKLFLCSARQLVNCQYEPIAPIDVDYHEDTVDSTTTQHEGEFSAVEFDEICQFYAPATRLPVANRYDRYIVCHDNGRSSIEECPSGSLYNALTMVCEQKPCTLDSNLCHNHGQCIDLSSHEHGFKCLCSYDYTGEYCEEYIQRNTTKQEHPSLSDHLKSVELDENLSNVDSESMTDDLNVGDKLMFVKTTKLTDNSFFSRFWNHYQAKNAYRQKEMNQWMRISYRLITSLIAFVLVISIVLSIIMCIRMLFSSPVETVGTWKNLEEEIKV